MLKGAICLSLLSNCSVCLWLILHFVFYDFIFNVNLLLRYRWGNSLDMQRFVPQIYSLGTMCTWTCTCLERVLTKVLVCPLTQSQECSGSDGVWLVFVCVCEISGLWCIWCLSQRAIGQTLHQFMSWYFPAALKIYRIYNVGKENIAVLK